MSKRTLIGNYGPDDGHGTTIPVWLHSVRSAGGLDPFLTSLVECYKRVFSGPPYYENYDGQENTFIIPTFREFVERGILVLLVVEMADNVVIGFGAGIPADKSEVAQFLQEHAHYLVDTPDKYLYMAELGVLPEFRHRGLGRLLVEARIRAATEEVAAGRYCLSHVIMRTASVGSNSARIYASLGAVQVCGLRQIKADFGTQSQERIFLSMPLSNPAIRAVG